MTSIWFATLCWLLVIAMLQKPSAQRALLFCGEHTTTAVSSLADLYDPNTMPPELVKAHQTLEKAVDLCYRLKPFINETKRIEFYLNCMIS